MKCDMCSSSGKLFRAEIEGAVLSVCGKCSEFGKVLGQISQPDSDYREEKKSKEHNPEVIDIIVEGYAEVIRKKREQMGLTQKDFAKNINEKESLIQQLESGNFRPGIELARKLQKALGIKLIEEYEQKPEKLSATRSEGFTLGDFIKAKKKPVS